MSVVPQVVVETVCTKVSEGSDLRLRPSLVPNLNALGDLVDREENRWLRRWYMEHQRMHR